MSALQKKMNALRGATRLFAPRDYTHFSTDNRGRLLANTAAPLYLQRILSQVEYAYRLTLARKDVDAGAVERAVDVLLACLDEQGAITRASAQQAEELLLPLRDAARQYTVHMVAHAHIDMNWQWPWHETVAVTLETFRTMLKLMEEDADFTFSQSQASCYRIVEQFEPAMLERIRRRVHEGRWEVTASTWVEADKNMPNLESMANHLLYTKEYLSRLLDIDPATLDLDYEPDTFGHADMVPEILSQGGVKYYYHCRGYDAHAIYNWQAPSGSTVLVYREPTWYLRDSAPNFALYVPEFCAQHGITEYLRVYGVGDHGGGPTRQDVSMIRQMMTWPVFPTIRFSNYHAFYRHLEAHKAQFPVVRQELNPVFTGCYTTQSRIKMSNRLGEAALSEAQALGAAAQQMAGFAPNPGAMEEGWRNVLFNQFHDILPGSGVRDTREQAMTKFSEALALAGTEYAAAMRAFAERMDTSSICVRGDADYNRAEGAGVGFGSMEYRMPVAERGGALTRIFHLFNPSAHDRAEPVRVTIWDWAGDLARLRFHSPQGEPLPCQLLTPRPMDYMLHTYVEALVYARVPAMGYATVVADEDETAREALPLPGDPRVEVPDRYVLENDVVRAQFDPQDGQLVSLIDKADGRELLGGGAGFRYIEEDPSKGMESWVVGRYLHREPVNREVRLSAVAHGPLRSSFEMRMPVGRASSLKAVVSLDAGARGLVYDVTCDFSEVGTHETVVPQLAFAAPFAYESESTLYDVPAGALRRAPAPQDMPAQTFAAPLARAGGAGLMLSTDSKYGFRTDKGEVQVTLIRAACNPDPYPERGEHRFKIVLHAVADGDPVRLANAARAAVRPVHVLSGGAHPGDLPMQGSFVELEPGVAMLSGVKPAQDGDGLILRLYDMAGSGGAARLRFFAPPRSAVRTDLLEKAELGAARMDGSRVELDLTPHAVTCLRVRW